jgi:hypothetical protein
MPVFATIFMIVTLSSIGLPGTNGFVGEFLILVGAFGGALRWWTVIATSGVILSAVYMLWMFQRVMFGELDNPKNQKLLDLNAREVCIMVPLIVMIFVMGIYPKPFIDKMDPAIKKLVSQARSASSPEYAGSHAGTPCRSSRRGNAYRPHRHGAGRRTQCCTGSQSTRSQVIKESIRPEDILDGHDYNSSRQLHADTAGDSSLRASHGTPADQRFCPG